MKIVTVDEIKNAPKPIEFFKDGNLEDSRELSFEPFYDELGIGCDKYTWYERLHLEEISAKELCIFFKDLSNYYKHISKKEKKKVTNNAKNNTK